MGFVVGICCATMCGNLRRIASCVMFVGSVIDAIVGQSISIVSGRTPSVLFLVEHMCVCGIVWMASHVLWSIMAGMWLPVGSQ